MRGLSKTIFAAILILETVAIPKLSAAGFTQEKNIVYGHKHGLGLLMDVFRPKEQNGACVVWVVSGGMNSGRSSISQLSNNPNFTTLLIMGIRFLL